MVPDQTMVFLETAFIALTLEFVQVRRHSKFEGNPYYETSDSQASDIISLPVEIGGDQVRFRFNVFK